MEKKMSEELVQKGLNQHGLKIGNYEFYNIGSTTLKQLKKYKIIPNLSYPSYETRKPDALLVDRRNKRSIKVILVIEHKVSGKFRSKNEKIKTVQQCNDLCQVLKADVGIATDNSSFIWFNPNHENPKKLYTDCTTKKIRSYSIIKNENSNNFVKEFVIDQLSNEEDLSRLNVKTKISIQNLELVRKNISDKNSKLIKSISIDPTSLAKQIWQDIWSVSGATPEKCLYTFIEL